MLLPLVVPLLAAPKPIAVPSTVMLSCEPFTKPLTVSVKPVVFCVVSTVLIRALLKGFTDAEAGVVPLPLVNSGLSASADKVGGSLDNP